MLTGHPAHSTSLSIYRKLCKSKGSLPKTVPFILSGCSCATLPLQEHQHLSAYKEPVVGKAGELEPRECPF